MQENQRITLAVVLFCVILFGWPILSVKMGWSPPPQDTPAAQSTSEQGSPSAAAPAAGSSDPFAPATSGSPAASVAPTASAAPATAPPAAMPETGRLVTVETPLYRAVFSTSGGILREFHLKQYRDNLGPNSSEVNIISRAAADQAPLGLLVDGKPTWTEGNWTLEGEDQVLQAADKGTLRFSTDVRGMRVTRELTFSGKNYTIEEKVRVESPSQQTIKLAFTFDSASLPSEKTTALWSEMRYLIFGGTQPVPEVSQYNLTRVSWEGGGSFSESYATSSDLQAGKLITGNVSWMAVMNNYFMGAVSLAGSNASAKGQVTGDVFRIAIGKTGLTVGPGAPAEETCSYYLGPKEAVRLMIAPNNLTDALNYGFFSFIAKPLVYLLEFFFGYVHNYGLAIILLTIVIKAVFWPLSQKSYKSMQQMKKLQPMMAKIREKHAGDKSAMNKEIIQLYKTYKVNPAGGCLPILVQLPVFFGLYQALLNAIELRHASFITHLPFTDSLWLADLSSRDPYFITPIVMGISMLIQQKMTPAPGDPMQARMMMLMPIFFTALFLNFPSGLVVYWLTNNIISIIQQWMQLRRA